MDRKEYFLEARDQNIRKEIEEFFLRHATVVRFTHRPWIQLFSFKKKATEQDPLFQQTLELLKSDFQSQETNNMLYNFMPQSKRASYTHYTYRLSDRMKGLLRQQGIFRDIEGVLYGFFDPMFFIDQTMLGYLISHESTLGLYLTDEEHDELQAKGVNLELAPWSTAENSQG